MGTPEDEPGRSPNETQHEVTLTRGFYLAETEVTQAQWVLVMGSNPSQFSGCDDCPVEQVSWYDAVDYCNARSRQEDRRPVYAVDGESVSWDQDANGYRLPTDAEWEYACRDGTTTPYYNGDIAELDCGVEPSLTQIGWYCGNNTPYGLKEVGQKIPNAWGLYDMSGSVHERCWDWYALDYPADPVTDPVGPDSGWGRVYRGGGWFSYARYCRSASRFHYSPESVNPYVGFRVAMWAP